MFLGDKVVYPMHGAVSLKQLKRKKFWEEAQILYYETSAW